MIVAPLPFLRVELEGEEDEVDDEEEELAEDRVFGEEDASSPDEGLEGGPSISSILFLGGLLPVSERCRGMFRSVRASMQMMKKLVYPCSL
mgnify:CR=1 FL=1